MDKLSGWVERHRRLVVALWAVALVAAVPFSLRQTDHLTSGGFNVPGSGSDRADAALHAFPGAQTERLGAVLELRSDARAGDLRAAVERVRRGARGVSHVGVPAGGGLPPVRRVGTRRIAILPLGISGTMSQRADAASNLRHKLGIGKGARDRVETHLVGQEALWAGMQDLSKRQLASAERIGFPIVLLILLAVFGSLAAASLPLALGVGSVTLTGAAIWGLSQATEMSVFTTNVASMIGIGVAVDYSLFVLARYREEIQGGATPEHARRTAMRTSGVAVAFSGLTVLIALGGLFLVNSTTIRSMAMGAIVVVTISILGAITLLPALMRMLGRRGYARGRTATVTGLLIRRWRETPRRRGRSHPELARPGFWQRWTERTMGRPVLAATLAAATLLVLAIPALSLKWGDGALRQFPRGDETRRGTELAAKVQGREPRRPCSWSRASSTAGRRTPATDGRSIASPRPCEPTAGSRPSCRSGRPPIAARRSSPSPRAAIRRAPPRARSWPGCDRRTPVSSRWRRSRTWRSEARPRTSRTSRTSSQARCGRSSCSCWRSATWCSSSCCARSSCR